MTTLRHVTGLLAMAALSAGGTNAQEPETSDNKPTDWRQTFIRVAGDDGVITEAEYTAYKTAGGDFTEEEARARFDDLAGDDGILTYAEVEATMVQPDKDSGDAADEERD